MIRHIKGIVCDAHPTHVVIDVQGVGYLVYTNAKIGCALGQETKMYTYLAVRENALDLYGFATVEELSFFELLLTLPKVGPKTALQLLSQASVSLLQTTIISQDSEHLSKMSGISKKTAEKIVLGLKDAFDGMTYSQENGEEESNAPKSAFISDTIDALVTLGYPQSDARKAVQQLIAQKPEITKVNEAITEVLRILSS